MSYLFPPNRCLLCPQFETYRLHSLDPDTDVSSISLPGAGATQSRVGYNQHHLSFKEVRGRISWDHLAVGEGGRGVYIDANWAVVGFVLGVRHQSGRMKKESDIDQPDLKPTFTQLPQLPVPVSSLSPSSSSHPAEYPSVRPLDPTHWAVSTGSGTLYVLETTSPSDATFSGELTACYNFHTSASSEVTPVLLQAVHSVSPTDHRLLLTRSIIPSNTGKYRSQTTAFELLEVSVDPTRRTSIFTSPVEKLDVLWTLRGGDLPFWCTWSGNGWLLLSGEEYSAPPGYEPQETEEAKCKREEAERNTRLGVGASAPASEPSATDIVLDTTNGDNQARLTEQPYSWTQTLDLLSVIIPFPAGTKRSDISIQLNSDSLSLSLSPSCALTPSPALSSLLQTNPTKQFWAPVDLASSTLTFDQLKSQLELDLVKLGDSTRWPSVFSPSDEDDEDEDDVPETIPASTIAAVQQTLNSIKTRQPGEPEGNHPAIPALLREEIDFDLEDGEDFGEAPEGAYAESSGGSKVGREVLVGYIKDGDASWSRAPTSVLSIPLNQFGIVVKSAVDGLLFDPPSSDPSRTPWKQKSTSPALAFVLSSKRDLRIVRHLTTSKGTTVLAFDAGSSSTASGNAYVYYPPASSTSAKQGVIRVSGVERGALLGVACVETQGKEVVVALCEKELVILHGVV